MSLRRTVCYYDKSKKVLLFLMIFFTLGLNKLISTNFLHLQLQSGIQAQEPPKYAPELIVMC